MTFAKKTQIRRVVMNGSGHGYLILSITGGFNRQCQIDCIKVKVLPAPMAHRAAPISVSVALGHASANAVKATAGAGPLVAPRV